MLDTAYPQLIDIVILTATGLVSIAVILLSAYVVRKSKRDFPTKSEINALRAEVFDLSGAQADLSERFSRFQKREGMREARQAKKSNAELLAEAAEMMQQQGDQPGQQVSKIELYKRARNH